MPYVEKGSVILIGATTENPSFEVNSALLSRCKVFVLYAIDQESLVVLLRRVISDKRGFGDQPVFITDDMLQIVATFANGDARVALNTLEMIILNSEIDEKGIHVTNQIFEQCISKKSLLYDKKGEEHYNIISALHKYMRNSDVHAAIYWLARMLEAGEDPLYVARRIIRFASEDIGMADSRALQIAVAAYQACHFLGMPECNMHLTHAVTYMSLAPKSNSLCMAYDNAKKDALNTMAAPVPLHICNAPTQLMKDLGYHVGYIYAHNEESKLALMDCLLENLIGHKYYCPGTQGSEAQVKAKMELIEKWMEEQRNKK